MAEIPEIAQALTVACLNHASFVVNLVPPGTRKGDTAAIGRKVGEFYESIYKAVSEAVE